MGGKITPWRRKKKVYDLAGELTTAMSFAVVGNPEKFSNKHHAFKVYTLLQDLGAETYPVTTELDKVGKNKVYPSLLNLPKQVDVVIPCLPDSFSMSIVQEAKEAGISKVWFQVKTLSDEAEEFCQANNLQIVTGCALMYKDFDSILKYANPCFWHYKTFTKKQK